MKIKKLITSESVGPGHPDKICDQISDLVLDECLKQDKNSRVACEVFASNRLIVIGGEITTKAYVDVVQCAWSVLKPLGYTENDFTIMSNINKQSPEIANKVNLASEKFGAGDQGIVFGYACNETKQLLPLTYVMSNEILETLFNMIKAKKIKGIKFDMKSQITIDFSNEKTPILDTVVLSVQHDANMSLKTLSKTLKEKIILPIVKKYKLNENFSCFVNHGGSFVVGGPIGDTGLTGRKIIVDSYGSIAHHGGGAFSGKDYTKVDRTGCYFARYIAKNIVAAKLAKKAEVQLSYYIGATKPLSIYIDTFNTNLIDLEKIYQSVEKSFNFDLYNIVETLKLREPNYSKTSVFGHFTKNFTWEKLDKVEDLKKNAR